MRKLLLCFFVFASMLSYSLENDFFDKLNKKDLATFNDAITLMRIIYNEKEDKDIFIENILWAAGKKLFQVTIPIKPDTINPVITRKEFAYWICKVFNLANTNDFYTLNRYASYYLCVDLGIMDPGRGADDTFTGVQILDTFSYLDYYVRYHKILPKEGMLEIVEKKDEYDDLPEWRRTIYKELDMQRLKESENFKKKLELTKQKLEKKEQKKETEQKKDDGKLKEKFIDEPDSTKL